MKKSLLIVLTILSTLLTIFGIFHIPILSSLGVKFPERNYLWGLSIIPTIILFAVPLILCITKWITIKRNEDNKKEP